MSGRPDAARPEWASGPEWEGWTQPIEWSTAISREISGVYFGIDDSGMMEMDAGANSAYLQFPDPADALEVANLIAEKLGGWGE